MKILNLLITEINDLITNTKAESKNNVDAIKDEWGVQPQENHISICNNVLELIKKLGSLENQGFHFHAADALGKIGNAVVAELMELVDKDSCIRIHAADALGSLGNAVVAALFKELGDKDSYVRLHAAEALEKLGNANDAVSDEFIKALKDRCSAIRLRAANALENIGNTNNAVVAALTKALWDQDYHVSVRAEEVLKNLGTPATPELLSRVDIHQQELWAELHGRL
ncbi:MAG: hypothetical protein COB50_04555 [Thiotrichales bacterium]|nr:MAG: hypothetical protein COB50_04555 [Thiotrichales bacterium]